MSIADECEKLVDRDPEVRDLVDRLMPAVLLAEEALRILGESDPRGDTRSSDRTFDQGTPSGTTSTALSSDSTGPRRPC